MLLKSRKAAKQLSGNREAKHAAAKRFARAYDAYATARAASLVAPKRTGAARMHL